MDACALERLDPRREVVAAASANRRIAAADDEKIAAKRATLDGAARAQRRREAVVPPDRVDGGRDAHQLRDRRRNHQRLRIEIEEALVARERLNGDAPCGAPHAGHPRSRRQIILKLPGGVDRWGCNDRLRWGRLGAGSGREQCKIQNATCKHCAGTQKRGEGRCDVHPDAANLKMFAF